jgi:hypothetical protein
MYEDLEQVSRAFLLKSYWREGWIGARQALTLDGAGMEAHARERLIVLERELRPRNLVQQVQSIVLSRHHGDIDLDEYRERDPDPTAAYQGSQALAERLGEEVAVDEAAFRQLLPELTTGPETLISFGAGLALGAVSPRTTWEGLLLAFGQTPEEKRNAQVLGGFLAKLGSRDPTTANMLLDEAIEHPILGSWFPVLQCALQIDPKGVERLRRSLALGVAPIGMFRCLAWGRAHATVTGADLKDLLERIATKARGSPVALEIVFFRFFGDKDAKRPHEPEIVDAGLALLVQMELDKSNARLDHELQLVVSVCIEGPAGETVAAKLCDGLKLAVANRVAQIGDYHNLFSALCKVQPRTVLDSFFGGNVLERRAAERMMKSSSQHRGNPLDAIPEDELVAWCDLAPEPRYVEMASVVSYLQGSEAEPGSHWSGIALRMMERSPDPVAVARMFAKRFRPHGWSGSLAVILESRKVLLSQLEQLPDPRLVEFARAEALRLAEEIEAERRWEVEHDRGRDERFE